MRLHSLPALTLASMICISPAWSAEHAATADGAKALLKEFVKPGADYAALSKPLQPTTADYATVFEAQTAAKAQAVYDPAWKAGQLVVKPNPGQTEVLLEGIPTAEIRAWTPKAANILPGGWAKLKGEIKEGLTMYRFKFVEPGKTTGMAYDGLVHVNGQWRIFPKAWRALEAP
jgi:hypothetical protein